MQILISFVQEIYADGTESHLIFDHNTAGVNLTWYLLNCYFPLPSVSDMIFSGSFVFSKLLSVI